MRGPEILGRYRLLAELGRGGMADVFLAVAQDSVVAFDKLLVIKCLRRQESEDPDLLSMFLDEARLAARLRHSNVVQAFEIGQEGDQYYLVLEYLDGQSLHRILGRSWRQKPMPLPLHLRALGEVLDGLQYAHGLCDYDGTPLGIVHRDVSPHNVFLTYDGQVKLVDFGIAKASTATVETRTGVVKGKLTYMAPEQACGLPVDQRADIFSVGVMLWEAIANRRLWDNVPEHQVLFQLTSGQLPLWHEGIAKADEPLRRICARALSLEPGDRYPSAEAMRQDLDDYLASLGVRSGPAALGRFVGELFEDRRNELRALVEAQLRHPAGLSAPGSDRIFRATAANPAFPAHASHLTNGTATGLRTTSSGAMRNMVPGAMPPMLPGAMPSGLHVPTAPPSFGYELANAPEVAYSHLYPAPHSSSAETYANHATTAALTRPSIAEARAETRRPWRRPWAIALGIASVAGLSFALAPRLMPTHRPAGPAAPAQNVTSLAAEFVEVRLNASPPNASLYYDDVPLPSNPYLAKFARDGTTHRLRVEAGGFRTQQSMLTLDKPQIELSIALEPEKAAKEKPETERGAAGAPGGRRPPVRTAPPSGNLEDLSRYRRPPVPSLQAEDPWDDGKR
ncbi:MAG: protein kinase [Polyangiaceae bacterium]|nr:protein kinase [Polyangiaceae bacterium]